MKRKALCFVLALFAIAIFSLGCGGGGGGSNPASSNVAGRARVSGVVYDSSNKPVPNADVKLVLASEALVDSLTDNPKSSSRFAKNGNETVFNTKTDNKGQYTFNNVPYGEYTLSAITADKAQIVTRLVVKNSTVTPAEIVLKPFGSISGTVTKAGSSQLDGTVVSIVNTSYCAITDSKGAFTLRNIPADTEFTISAMASGYETATTKATIVASKSLELTSVALSLSAVNRKGCTLNARLTTIYSPVTVFAISDDGTFSYAGKLVDGVCSLIITNPGTYNVIPAYLADGNNFAGSISTVPVSEEQIRKGQSVDVALTMGTIPSGSTNYAVLKGNIDNSSSSDSSFGVSLFGSKGNELRKSVSGNTNFEINSIPEDNYSVVVFSANSLQVLCNVDMKKGEVTDLTGKIKPIKLNPTITNEENSGIATITFNSKGIISSLSTDSSFDGRNKIFFSVKAEGSDSKPVTLCKVSSDGTTTSSFDAYSENDRIEQALSVDNLSASDTIGKLVITFNNAQTQPIFETTYNVNGSNPKYKKVTLGTVTSSENVILFKAFEISGQPCYLVVTSTRAYVFKSDGTQAIAPVNFSDTDNLTGSGNFTSVKYGNACYFTTSGKPSLAFQFIGNNTKNLYVFSAVLSGESFVSSMLMPTPNSSATGGYDDINQPYSANKLFVNSGKYYSVCDNYLLIYDSTDSSWKPKEYFGETIGVVASHSTVLPGDSDYLTLCYLGQERDTSSPDIILGIDKYVVTCSCYQNYLKIKLDPISTYNFNANNLRQDDSSTAYYYYLTGNDFPYSLTDCLDNKDAENKVFINNSSDYRDTRYIYSDTVYVSTNIKSSYIFPGNDSAFPFEAWIERDSKGQNLILRNQRSFKEQKISINQVCNSSAYLEGSISYTTVNGNQIHVLCADGSNLKVLVLNCIEGNN